MFKFIKSMTWFIKKNWYRYCFVLFFGLILTVINLIPASLTGNLAKALENGTLDLNFLLYSFLFPFIGTFLLLYFIATSKRICQLHLTTTLYRALHVRYIENIMVQDSTFFEKFQSGDLLVRALGDINTVKYSGGNRLLNIFMEAMTVVVTFIAMCFINPVLAICSFIPLSCIFFANLFLKAKVKRNWKIVREKNSEMGNVVLESITNVRTIRAFSKEEENLQKNISYSNRAYQVEKANLKINVIFQPMFQSIVAVSMIICYSLGAYFYYLHEITIASLLQFIFYLNLFQSPLINIGNMINNFYQSLISADRLNEVYNATSSVVDLAKPKELEEIKFLEFKHFSFTYYSDLKPTLEDISFTLKKGQVLGIVGHTGSGKSSIVRQLVRQTSIANNTIYLNGYPIETYDQKQVRRRISYVPQEHMLFSRSVYDNIALGSKNATKEQVLKAIKLASFEDDIASLPQGLDTIVGEYGVTLSGGQKQRITIARAFIKDSDLLILDDSLSAVDGKTESNILKSLVEVKDAKGVIIVAHRLTAVASADEIIVVDYGRIIERGTHQQLMELHGWYYEQFISQQMNSKEVK